MRFETFEPRYVFDQSLGPAVEISINAATTELDELPPDIQFRSGQDDFRYYSREIDPATLDAFISATESWNSDPYQNHMFYLNSADVWRKIINHNPISVAPSGYIVTERVSQQLDYHTMIAVQQPQNECYTQGGLYTRPDYHYRFSFDIRFPETEQSWLTTVNDHWAVVTQFWGPVTAGDGLNPPLSIHTSVRNGVPYWVVSSRGDANAETIRPYDEERFQYVPMEGIGGWHRWDIEYVPNHEGWGLVRAWIDGELVADWVDIKSSYLAYYEGEILAPMNPSVGVYAYDAVDGLEGHFDNVTLQCSGNYVSSIAGQVTGTQNLGGNVVYATNSASGERYGVLTGDSGVYTLELPRGNYTVTAVSRDTGYQMFVENVSTVDWSQIVDLDVTPVSASPPPVLTTLSGDVTGDGAADILHFMADGTWHVSSVDSAGNVGGYVWASWPANTAWKDVMVGDFNGDGRQDVIGRADNGNWWVGVSTGTSFQNVLWGKWTPTIDWLNVNVGDFNGDGKSDIVGRAATNGSWWVGASNGSQFSNAEWSRWATWVDWEVLVGDFNGDGRSDIAGRASTDGTIWIGASTGSRFLNSYWGRFSSSVRWSDFMVGDFNGDGRSDLVARVSTDGTWWVAESQGNRFNNRYFGRWSTATGWTDLHVADVNGDGRSDVVGRSTVNNSWWIGRSTGLVFQNLNWGATWAQNIDWLVALVDDFDGDDAADLVGGNARGWWLYR